MADIQQKSLGLQDQNKQQAQQPQTPGPMSSTGAMTPGNIPSSSRTTAFSTGAQQSSGSGRFTNLQSYINANKPAGEQLGQKVAQQVGQGIEKSQKEATTQAGQIREAIGDEKARIGEATRFQKQVEEDPTKVAADAAARQRFQQLTSGATNAGQLQSQAETTQAQASNQYQQMGQKIAGLGTEAGRFNALKETIRQPGYSTGQQRLDQLFLQTANPQALAQQQQALQSKLGQAQTGLQEAYQGEQGIAKEFAGDTGLASQARKAQQALTGALSGQTEKFMTEQGKEAQALSGQNAASNAALNQFFTNGYGTLSDKQKAIIDPMLQSGALSAGTRTYNVLQSPDAYKQYMTQGRADLTSADVVNAQELQRIQALQQLSGIAPEKYTFTQAGNVGPQAGINAEQLQKDIQAQADIFNKTLNTPNATTLEGYTPEAKTLADVQKALTKFNYDPNLFQGVNQFGFQNQSQLGNIIQELYHTPVPNSHRLTNDPTGYVQKQNTRQMLENYLNLINSSGYNQGLGGVAPTAANQFGVLPGNPGGQVIK